MRAVHSYSILYLNMGMQITKIVNSKCIVQGLARCLTCSSGSQVLNCNLDCGYV